MSSWNPFSYPPRAVLKTIYGFLLPGVVALGGAFARAALDPNKPVTKYDVIAALVAMFVTGGTVFGVTNKPPGEVTPEEAEGGYATLNLALLVIGLVLLAVAVLGLLHVLAIALSICIILVVIGFLLVVGAQFGGTLP